MRVADALDMARGRSRVPFEAGHRNIHSLSAYAIEEVRLEPGEDKAVRVEIEMSNRAGIFQVDELLATKLRGSRPRGAHRGRRPHRRRARGAPARGLPDLGRGPPRRSGAGGATDFYFSDVQAKSHGVLDGLATA